MAPNVKGDVDVANVKGDVADGTELAAPNVNGVNGAMEGAELVVLDAPKLKLGVTGFDGAEPDDPSNGAVADDEPKLPKALAAGEAPRKAAGAEVDTSLSGAVGADPLKSVAPGTAGKTVFASVAVPNVVLGTGVSGAVGLEEERDGGVNVGTGASGAAGLEEERDGGANEVWLEFDAASVCTRALERTKVLAHASECRNTQAQTRHARATRAHILAHTHARLYSRTRTQIHS